MQDTIIIDEYHKRSIFNRIVNDGATTFLWAGWSWLCKFHHFFNLRFLFAVVPPALEDPAVALISTSSVLLLWNSIDYDLPVLRKLEAVDYANHFGLSENELVEGRNTRICIVHHDEFGNIIKIER